MKYSDHRAEQRRKEKDLTQEELAKKSGISLTAYKDYLKGTDSDLYTLKNIANTLDVSIDWLVERSDYLNIGNKEVSEITGLSNRAIECLRKINEENQIRTKDGGFLNGNDHTIEMLNLILEAEYDRYNTKKLPENRINTNILSILWDYCLADHAKLSGVMDWNTFQKSDITDNKALSFEVEGGHQYFLNPRNAFKAMISDQLTKALLDLSRKVWKE